MHSWADIHDFNICREYFNWTLTRNLKELIIYHLLILDKGDLSEIIEEILPIGSKYYSLGRSLNLKIVELRKIRDKNPSESDALEDVLLLWLNQDYDVKKHGPPTWKLLVEAVNKKSGGDNHELAKQIASNHPAGTSITWIIIKIVYVLAIQ